MWPVLLDWGPLRLHSYGLMVAAGFLCALILAQRSGEKASLTTGQTVDLALICLVGGLVGGRLLYVLIHATYFRLNPAEIFMIHKGGLAFFGALAGGFLAGAFWVRRWGRSVLEVSDFLIVYVPLAHAFGRIGCFLNGCCWGTPFGAAWAVHFPHLDHPVHPVQVAQAVHPVLAVHQVQCILFSSSVYLAKKYLQSLHLQQVQ